MKTTPTIALWGGIECTINRVGEQFFDQLERCGHYSRSGDLEAIAALGIKTLRYPALWERVAPHGLRGIDWTECDRTMQQLRDLDVEPIIGLVHHGSGPAGTHLLDPRFVDGLAAYAAAFAERYPWVRQYTPINEPLTTARFAGLYGHWYPHRRDDRAFVAALVTQCRAIAAAMAAIREHVPNAALVQTEDAGSVRSTAAVAAQAAFENHRRWLSLDLITGRVGVQHPLWQYLCDAGADQRDLHWLREHPTPPAILGLNYYVTSDRFLDDRLDRWPTSSWGGNGRQQYADVDAVRVPGIGLRGHSSVLLEAWRRYELPLAITEAHLGCTREEQMRWLLDAWRGAHDAAAHGAAIQAVTTWALLGSWNWNSLLRSVESTGYEPGAFDVEDGGRRQTAVGQMIAELARHDEPSHPVLAVPGWWRRDAAALPTSHPIVITGASGTLGRAFVDACAVRGIPAVALSRHDLDISNPDAVLAVVSRWQPWAIVNAAGYVRVDDAERERSACRRANAVGPAVLAAVCRRRGVQLLTFSSDLVFDGTLGRPYVESDPVGPLNVYGRTKIEAERRVLALAPATLVVRTSAFFGPSDRANFVTRVLDTLERGEIVRAAGDAIVSPTYVPDLVNRALDLLIDGAAGVWHLANAGALSWMTLARMAATAAGLDPAGIEPSDSIAPARRPLYSALASERGPSLPPLSDSLARYVRDRVVIGEAA